MVNLVSFVVLLYKNDSWRRSNIRYDGWKNRNSSDLDLCLDSKNSFLGQVQQIFASWKWFFWFKFESVLLSFFYTLGLYRKSVAAYNILIFKNSKRRPTAIRISARNLLYIQTHWQKPKSFSIWVTFYLGLLFISLFRKIPDFTMNILAALPMSVLFSVIAARSNKRPPSLRWSMNHIVFWCITVLDKQQLWYQPWP